ncbi:MAG: hypothetical protein MJ233_00335 [Mycoplasmoidaceae bacterium]|nr:hypothetical protein [Mycoplasmoidaceae bacterium]
MTPKKEQHYDTEKDVIEAYNADLKSNKKIYSDDFVYFQSQGKQTYSYIDGEMKKITHTVSSVGDIKEYESMIGTEPKSIGFPISLEMTLDATITVHGDGYTGTLEYKNSKMTLTNIPVRCVDRSIVNVDLLTDHYILNDTS